MGGAASRPSITRDASLQSCGPHRLDAERPATLDPGVDDPDRTGIDADRPAAVALAMQYGHRSRRNIEILQRQRQGLAEAQPGPVQQRDERPVPQPVARGRRALRQHASDLLGGQHLGGVALALVGRRLTPAIPGVGDLRSHRDKVRGGCDTSPS